MAQKTGGVDFTSSPILSGAAMGAVLGQVDVGTHAYEKVAHTYERAASAVLQSFAAEKRAAAARAFVELTAEPVDLLDEIYQAKKASAADEHLMNIAEDLPGDTLETYEALGGEFKVAFGQPMFRAPSPTSGMGPTGAPKLQSPSAGPQRPSISQGPTGGVGPATGPATGTPDMSGAGAGL